MIPQVLTLVEKNRGPDDDGDLVINYELYRENGTLLASIQSTNVDAVIFPQADKWTVSWVDHRCSDGSIRLPDERDKQ